MSKPGVGPSSGISLGDAWDCPSGIRHVGGAKLNLALVRNVRTWPAMPREKAQAAPTARPKVPMRRRGADCPGGVMPVERRGRVIAVELGPTGLYPGRSPKFQRKAAAFVRWHEPDDARVSSPESVRGSG